MKLIEFAIRKDIDSPPVVVSWDVNDMASIEQSHEKGFCCVTKKDGQKYYLRGSYRSIMNRWIYALEINPYVFDDPVIRPSVSLYNSNRLFQPDPILLDEPHMLDICEALFPEKLEHFKKLWQSDPDNE